MATRTFFIITVVMTLTMTPVARADRSLTGDPGGAISVLMENDFVTGDDSNYTNGVGISWTSDSTAQYDAESLVRRWKKFWAFLPGVRGDDVTSYVSWTVGQEMHTPDDITVENPAFDDQPYAGVLFLDSDLHSRRGRWAQSWHLRLGLVGPDSGADRLQRWVHRNVSADLPRGWERQLPNEPIINVGFTGGYGIYRGELSRSLSTRLTSLFNVEAGNYATSISTGGLLEIGKNLSSALSISSLGQGLNTAMVASGKPDNRLVWSAFVGLGATIYAHYLPLNGTVFRDSISVDANTLVGFGATGVSLRYGRLAVSLAGTRFTKTFKTQRGNVHYGILSLAWYF